MKILYEEKAMSQRIDEKPTRREALQTGALLSAGLAAPGLLASAASAKSQTMLTKMLGKTAERISVLTLGTGHFRASLGLDAKKAGAIVERAIELGVASIDTAPNYSEAEDFLGEVLPPHRDKIFLATKTEAATYDGCWEQLRTSMKRMKTDRLDLVYLHNWGEKDRFPDVKAALGKQGALGALREAQRLGVVRFIGASGHLYPSRFMAILEKEEFDVVMCLANFVAKHIYNFEEKVFEYARLKDVGVIAMKALGGAADWSKGAARVSQEHYQTAIRYALNIPGVASLNIGFRKVEELEQAVKTILNAKPLKTKEIAAIEEMGKQLAPAWGAAWGEPVA